VAVQWNSIISNKPTTTTEQFDAFHGFMLIKIFKKTLKGGLHFTVICYMNKCIINERYIPEHQNKLNIYDLQSYEFFCVFFQPKKIRKIR